MAKVVPFSAVHYNPEKSFRVGDLVAPPFDNIHEDLREKLKEDVKPISYIKSHTADILKQINSNHRPIFITQKRHAKAVIIDTDSYENLINAISILELVNESEEEIKNGNFISHDKFKKQMNEKMKIMAENNG